MLRILLPLVGWILWVGAAEKPPLLFRIHLQAPEGVKGMVTVPVNLFNPPETIAIRNIPEVSERDLLGAKLLADGTILIQLSDFGKTKLEVATSSGRGLILVVIVNGRVVYAPLIDVPLTQGKIALPSGSLLPQEIESMNEQKSALGGKTT